MDNRMTANEVLLYLEGALKQYPNEELLSEIKALREQNAEKRYIVSVTGEFKRGKSSLINAMLGMPVLPMGIEPMTAVLNRVTYGRTPKVLIKRKDGVCVQIKMEDLSAYVTKQGAQMSRLVNEAVIEYPTFLCESGIDILDTPGMNDEEEMSEVTGKILEEAHAAVVAVSATLLFSETEAEWVATLIALDKLEYLMFAVTFIDRVRKEEQPKLLAYLRKEISAKTKKTIRERYGSQQKILDKADRLLDPERMFLMSVSPKDALDAFVNGNDELLQSSNLPEFKRRLFTLLTAQQESYILRRTRQLVSQTEEWIEQSEGNLQWGEELQTKQVCETALEFLSHYTNEVQKIINGLYQKLQDRMKAEEDSYMVMESAVDAVLADARDKITTNEDAHLALQRATLAAKEAAKTWYQEKWDEQLLPIVKDGADRILQIHSVLYQYCGLLDEIPVLWKEEDLIGLFWKTLPPVWPSFKPGWTLDITGGLTSDLTEGMSRVGEVFAGGAGWLEKKMSTGTLDNVNKAKEKISSAWRNSVFQKKAGEVYQMASEKTSRNLVGKNLSEMVRPEISRIATSLHLSWKEFPEVISRHFISVFIENENLKINTSLEMALQRKAGELNARLTTNSESQKKSSDEASAYLEKAHAAVAQFR